MGGRSFEEMEEGWKSYYSGMLAGTGTDLFRAEFERTTFVHTWYNSVRVIEERTGIRDGARVLDAGCGWGRMLVGLVERYTALDVTAMDLQSDGLELGRSLLGSSKNGNSISWVQGNIESLEFPDDTFDVAYSARVFQHLDAPDKGVREIVRVLKPGGRFGIFLQNKFCPLNFRYYARLYSPPAVRRWFKDTGVTDLRVASIDFYPGVLAAGIPLGARMGFERLVERVPLLNLLGGKVLAWGTK